MTIVTTGTFPVSIEHPEEGVKAHTGYWSEGCLVLGSLSNQDILDDDIKDIIKSGGTVTAILKVEDRRSEAEKAERPLPYELQKNETCTSN